MRKPLAEAKSKSDADFARGLYSSRPLDFVKVLSKTVAQMQTLDAKDQAAATDLLKRIKITTTRARMELGKSSGAD